MCDGIIFTVSTINNQMKKKKQEVKNLYYQQVAGPMAPFIDEALVHIRDSGNHTRAAFVHAYLPTLEKGGIKVEIEEGTEMPNVKVQQQAKRGETLKGTTITIVYTSKKGAENYYLWQIGFSYSSEVDYGLDDVILKDLDPETTRGTVTTVEDPDPDVKH